jgi:hypothetical protein
VRRLQVLHILLQLLRPAQELADPLSHVCSLPLQLLAQGPVCFASCPDVLL